MLLEPFAVALENDRRLHELMALREKVEAENRSLLTKLGRNDLSDAIVGAESGLRSVMDRVNIVARADVPVLILGETGSGKEVVARAIHNQSRRNGGPFLRVNCGALPPELVDSELFGHERGSFTGATALRKGWFERADRGTLFLDECGELPPAAQVRLLRILQDGTFERVGGERQMHVDVRVVAATHRNLQSDGRRRNLPRRSVVSPGGVSDRTAAAARSPRRYSGAGHALCSARRQAIWFALAHADAGRHQFAGGVPLAGKRARAGGGDRTSGTLGRWKATGSWHGDRRGRLRQRASKISPLHKATDQADSLVTLDAAMKRHIEAALQRTRGRIEGGRGAAKVLGINPHTLRARMRKLRIDWGVYRAE